jgi:hypothetical protein
LRDYRLRIADCGLRVADCGLRVADCGLRVADCGLRIADCGLRVAGCGLRVADCGLRIADCGLRVAGCGLRIADCGLRVFRGGVCRAWRLGFSESWRALGFSVSESLAWGGCRSLATRLRLTASGWGGRRGRRWLGQQREVFRFEETEGAEDRVGSALAEAAEAGAADHFAQVA